MTLVRITVEGQTVTAQLADNPPTSFHLSSWSSPCLHLHAT
jgi:hypothetical protein